MNVDRLLDLLDWKHRSMHRVMLCVCLFFVLVGLINPSFGIKASSETQQGLDVMVMLDVSKSMQVMDIDDAGGQLSRLDSAKIMLEEFVTNSPENRYGLGVFAGEALGIAPLTSDTNLFLTFLSGVDYRNLSIQGTDLSQAVGFGLDRFDTGVVEGTDGEAKLEEQVGRVLLIISDGGEDDVSIDANMLSTLRSSGVFVLTVGIGTTQGGSIPLGKDVFGNITYRQFEGETVVASFDPRALKNLASGAQGDFYWLEEVGDISTVSTRLEKLDKKDVLKRNEEKRRFGRWFIFFGLLSFASSLVLSLFGVSQKKLIEFIGGAN